MHHSKSLLPEARSANKAQFVHVDRMHGIITGMHGTASNEKNDGSDAWATHMSWRVTLIYSDTRSGGFAKLSERKLMGRSMVSQTICHFFLSMIKVSNPYMSGL